MKLLYCGNNIDLKWGTCDSDMYFVYNYGYNLNETGTETFIIKGKMMSSKYKIFDFSIYFLLM